VRIEPPANPPDGETTVPRTDGGQVHAVSAVVSLNEVEVSRRESVLAYCARLCDPDRIAEAVEASFAELHDALETADGHAAIDLDRILLEKTRTAAAERSDASAALPGFAGLSLRRSSACELMPTLLAARASELLGESDLDRVDKHLARCAACRELERRRREAERAYELLRSAPPAGAAEPFASPGDEAPEVIAEHQEPLELEPEPEPAAEETVVVGNTDDTKEHEVVAAAEPEEPAPETSPALRNDVTGEYAFELADPEPLEDDHDADPATVAVATPPARRSTWVKWATVVGPLAAAAIAIGTIAALGDGDESERQGPTTTQNLAPPPRPSAAPAPADTERPSRTERRMEALGDRVLSPGMKGPRVRTLQRLLGVPQTGTYDALTQYAVGEF